MEGNGVEPALEQSMILQVNVLVSFRSLALLERSKGDLA